MITDNQAKEAIKTIALYCRQQERPFPCLKCALRYICINLREHPIPEDWPKYLD